MTGPQDQQPFETQADLTSLWAHRPLASGDDPHASPALLDAIDLGPETFVWIAAEIVVARGIRTHLVTDRAYPPSWIPTAGCRKIGEADAHGTLE